MLLEKILSAKIIVGRENFLKNKLSEKKKKKCQKKICWKRNFARQKNL